MEAFIILGLIRDSLAKTWLSQIWLKRLKRMKDAGMLYVDMVEDMEVLVNYINDHCIRRLEKRQSDEAITDATYCRFLQS